MRLFLVGSDNEYAIENFYVKYLKEAGVEVYHFPAQTIFYQYYQQGLVNKVLFRAGLSGILKKINQQFKVQVQRIEPDIIWIFKGMEIFPNTLKWARSKGIKLVNYNGDSPFIFSGRGSGNKNVTGSIGLYDLFLTYSDIDKKKMETEYRVKSRLIPFGFEISDALFDECQRIKEIKKTCFIGNADSSRTNFLCSLANKGIQLDVYGDNWNQLLKQPGVSVYPPVKNDNYWRTLRSYRIQLNLMRPHNPTTHNMRTFEAAGVGAIQLAPDTPDHRFYFECGKEIFLFRDIDSCILEINKLMNLSAEAAQQIRINARKRSTLDAYNYQYRSREALVYIKELIA